MVFVYLISISSFNTDTEPLDLDQNSIWTRSCLQGCHCLHIAKVMALELMKGRECQWERLRPCRSHPCGRTIQQIHLSLLRRHQQYGQPSVLVLVMLFTWYMGRSREAITALYITLVSIWLSTVPVNSHKVPVNSHRPYCHLAPKPKRSWPKRSLLNSLPVIFTPGQNAPRP